MSFSGLHNSAEAPGAAALSRPWGRGAPAGCSATEDTGTGTSPRTPHPSLPSLRVFRSCSQALGAGQAGPLNASPANVTLALRNRVFSSPSHLSAPPQAGEEEGTGDRQCRQVTLQLRPAGISTDLRAYSYIFSLCFLGMSQLFFSPGEKKAIWGVWTSHNTDDTTQHRRNMCHTCEITFHPVTAPV